MGDVFPCTKHTDATATKRVRIFILLVGNICDVHIILSLPCGEQKRQNPRSVKRNWQTVRDNLQKAGWNCVCISSTDEEGRQFCFVAAERKDAGRFIVHADEMLTAFLELECAIRVRLSDSLY